MSKLVSIIIPTYSRPHNLCRAIDSVLSQTYKNIEIIVIDDNGIGTPNQIETECILQKYMPNPNFFYFKHEKNRNGSAARNTGIKLSKGQYVGFLDDDDEFVTNKIETQINAMERLDKSWGGCYCNIALIGRKRTITKNEISGSFSEDLLLGTVRFNTSSLLLRKEVCLELNGFDENFKRHQDWEFMLRFFRKYKLYLPERNILLNKYSSRGSVCNLPKGSSFIEIKEKFLTTFKHDIDQLDKANLIYHKHWMEVASSLLLEKRYKLFYKYFRISNSYSRLSLKDLKALTLSFILSFT